MEVPSEVKDVGVCGNTKKIGQFSFLAKLLQSRYKLLRQLGKYQTSVFHRMLGIFPKKLLRPWSGERGILYRFEDRSRWM
jgi:hypothetical protein